MNVRRLVLVSLLVSLLVALSAWAWWPVDAQDVRSDLEQSESAGGSKSAEESSGDPLRTNAGQRAGVAGEWAWVEIDYAALTTLTQGGNAQRIDLYITGPCRLWVVDSRVSDTIVKLHMPEIQVKLQSSEGSADAAELEAGIREPVFVRLAGDGRVLGYRFPDSLHKQWRNTLRSLWTSLRAPILGDSWKGAEGDAGGIADLDVRCVSSPDGSMRDLQWVRTGYQKPSSQGVQPKLRGEGHARFDRSRWPQTTTYQEKSEVSIAGGEIEASQQLRVGSRRLDQGSEVHELVAGLWSDEWSSADGLADAVAMEEDEAAGIGEAGSLRDQVRSIQLLSQQGREDSGEFYEAFQALIDSLRGQRIRASEVRGMLFDLSLDLAVLRALCGAAGAAGTSELQRVLVEMAKSSHMPEDRRACALIALVQTEQPDGQTVQELFALAMDPSMSQQMRGSSLLMLGAMAGKQGAPPELVQSLIGLEGRAAQDGLLPQFLMALGNAGIAPILPVIQRHIEGTDGPLRAAAVDALCRMGTPEALELVRRCVAGDPLPAVRAKALGSLERHAFEVALPVIEIGLRDVDIEVRKSAAKALAARKEPQAAALLARLKGSDPSPAVRAFVDKLTR